MHQSSARLITALISASFAAAVLLGPAPVAASAIAGSTSVTSVPAQAGCDPTLSRVAYDECLVRQLHVLQGQLRGQLRKESNRFGQARVAAIQTKWKSFVNSECTLEASLYRGGTAYGGVLEDCLIALTSARLTTLLNAVAAFPH